jgi:sugar phosphate isomerase/epimerase
MNQSRRKFIVNSSLSLAGTMFLSNDIFADNWGIKNNVSIQLYSVRDDMKKNPRDTLKKLSAMGYQNVEHANYVDRKFYGYAASEFKKLLSGLGLKMKSGHTVMSGKHWDKSTNDFTDEWKYTVEDAATVGQRYVISPWMEESIRTNYDSMMGLLDVFNKCGELCKKSGLKFGYHNHDFEFSNFLNKKMIYDIILENTDPALVAQQMDIGNMYEGGGKPLDLLKKYQGRFETMHVKDEKLAPKKDGISKKYESCTLGTGIVPVKKVVDLAKKIGGTTEFIIEQEDYQGKTPLASMKEDLTIMKKWGF